MTCCQGIQAGTRELSQRSPVEHAAHTKSALVFDWGKRHVGVALVANVTGIAMPLKTLAAQQSKVDHAELDRLMRDHTPEVLVVGLPRNMDGSDSAETKQARRFGEHLAKRYERDVFYVDERLTTREAVDRSQSPHPDHSIAALVIAESWLAEQKS